MSRLESFRAARWIRTFNLLLQGLLFLTLCGGLNYLALHFTWRYDLTAHRRHSLSPETQAYLENLRQPVHIVVTLSADSENEELAQAYRDVRGLLREYVYATENNPVGRITVDYLDIYQHRREAERLKIDRPNTIILLSDQNAKQRVIDLDSLYVVENREKKAFRGEQAFTSAILEIASPKKKKIYFLTGHGEMDPNAVDGLYGLSAFKDELMLRNFTVDVVDLAQKRQVPDDADLLVAASPRNKYWPFEEEMLRQYLATRAGRLILLLSPGGGPHGLDRLLDDWGILSDDVVVCDNTRESVTETGDLRITEFPPHPINQSLRAYGIPLTLGYTRVARPDPGRTLDPGLDVQVIAATAATAWGERDYRQQGVPRFDAGVDLKGLPEIDPKDRLGVIVASERKTPAEGLPFSVRGGRLVVFGNADLASNNRITNPGNQNILLNAVNWTVDRDTQLAIPPRPIDRFQLVLSQQQLARLRYSLLLGVPGAIALLGLLVYWTRRS
ncbi:MAG TPA: GldG family protein [Opitutaceae bacterium]